MRTERAGRMNLITNTREQDLSFLECDLFPAFDQHFLGSGVGCWYLHLTILQLAFVENSYGFDGHRRVKSSSKCWEALR